MRCKCAMYGCRAASYNKVGYLLNFHRFPKDPERLKIWKDICKNPAIMSKTHNHIWLCSLHFERSCYFKEYLKPDAVPTLKLPDARTANNETRTDSNDSSSKAGDEELSNIDKDDRDSVNFSTSSGEDKGSDDDEGSNRESPEPSRSDVGVEEHPPAKVQAQGTPPAVPSSNLVGPVYQSLPKITRVSSIAKDKQTARPSTSRTAPISAAIDKVPSPGPVEPVYQSLPMINRVSSIAEDKSFVEDHFEEVEEDDCSTFAAHIKMRMRRFDNAQKVIAQKLISDILFMADTKQLNLASAVVNPQARAAQLVQAAQVPQAVNNCKPKTAVGSSFSAFVIDSDDDDGSPVIKKKK